jgi:hypothetical protein
MTPFKIRKRISRFYRLLNSPKGIAGYDTETNLLFYFHFKSIGSFTFVTENSVKFFLVSGNSVVYTFTTPEKLELFNALQLFFDIEDIRMHRSTEPENYPQVDIESYVDGIE